MLKFFRRIRRKLIDEGNLKRYLIYAIGEVFLVMIGILLALQVNKWNEAVQTRKLETKYLQRLQKDLIQDTIYFSRRIDASKKIKSDHYSFIQKMYEEQKDKQAFTDLLSLINWNSDNLTVQNSTFTEMISSGKLDIISNESLKENIILLYKRYEEISADISGINETSKYHYRKIMSKHYKYRPGFNRMWGKETFFDNREWQCINQPFSEDFRLTETTVAYYLGKHGKFVKYFNELEEMTKSLIEQIQKEVTK